MLRRDPLDAAVRPARQDYQEQGQFISTDSLINFFRNFCTNTQAVINEDVQGSVEQLQLEIKRLKERLSMTGL